MSLTKGKVMCTHETVFIIQALISAFLSSSVSCCSHHIRRQSQTMMSQLLIYTNKTMYYSIHMYVTYIRMYVCVCVCVYECVCIYIYMYIHTHTYVCLYVCLHGHSPRLGYSFCAYKLRSHIICF